MGSSPTAPILFKVYSFKAMSTKVHRRDINIQKVREKLGRLNQSLSRCSVRLKDCNLYIRATLPSRDGEGRKQYEISLRAPANDLGLRVAEARAKELDSMIILGSFTWEKWDQKPLPSGDRPREKKVSDWVAEFERHYWQTRTKTASRQENYRHDYERPFSDLPEGKLTAKLLIQAVLEKSPPDSRKRKRYCMAFGCLAKFAGIEVDLEKYKGNYVAPMRVIPSDEDLQQVIDKIGNPQWRWIAALLATYGLRPHEVFYLDFSRMDEDGLLLVKDGTKTNHRQVLPCLPDWVERWELPEQRYPSFSVTGEESNKKLGAKICKPLVSACGFSPYVLRDAYAVRLAVYGFPDAIAAKLMGHSLQVHFNHYQKHLDERGLVEAYQRVFSRGRQT